MICRIAGCGRVTLARNLCGKHYQRWSKHGDPNIYRIGSDEHLENINVFFEKAKKYKSEKCLIWPFNKNTAGYGIFQGRLICRILCEIDNGQAPTKKHEAAHSCGNGHLGCCNRNHLRWATHTENQHDRIKHGTVSAGENHGGHKLTTKQVFEIRRLWQGGVRAPNLAKRFRVSQSNILFIIRNRSWVSEQGKKDVNESRFGRDSGASQDRRRPRSGRRSRRLDRSSGRDGDRNRRSGPIHAR